MTRRGGSLGHSLARGLTVLALLASLLAIVPGNVGTANAELTTVPDETWGVVGLFDSLTTDTASEVMAIEQIGNTIYVGGQFLEVVHKRNEPHHDQPFLAAFDATTGDWIDWWRPDLNGSVYALEASPDGSRLYVGGEFTSINGIGDTVGLVALDAATGEVDSSFTAHVEGAPGITSPGVVRTLRAVSNWVYVGGSFNYITGPDLDSRTRIYRVGRLSAADGTPDASWRPFITGGSVWGLDVDESRGRVYLAGFFEAVNSEPDTGHFVAIRTSDATPITTHERFPVLSPSQPHQFEVLVDGDSVWVVGTQHVIHKLNASDLSMDRRWFTGFEAGYQIGGDFQSIGILGDRIYASCHCWGVIRELPPDVLTLNQARQEPLAGEINGIIAFGRTSGDWIDTFVPDLYGPLGGFAIHGAPDGCLWGGGDFNRRAVGDQYNNGIVRFCDESGQGPPAGPPLEEPPDNSESNPPSRPLNPAVANGPGDDVILSWTPSTDDTAVATYVLYRDGAEVKRTRRAEAQVAPGGLLSVQAIDPFGNVSHFSNPIATDDLIPDVLGRWPLDDGAIDMSGNGNDGTMSGALNTPGRIIDAQQLESGDTIIVAANDDLKIGAGDGDFSISGWLRLDTGSTGSARNNLVANGVATLGTASSTNRVRATIDTSTGTASFLSTTSLTVGEWHHVALVRESNEASLYVDGSFETSLTLTGSTSAGTGAFTMRGDTARLDEVVIHDGALTASHVDGLADPDMPDALWAYYPMEGDAVDHSGNGFHGVLSGAETQTGVHGLGLNFDGSNGDEIVIANNAALHPGENGDDFSVSFWMNLQQRWNGNWRTITHKGTTGADRTFSMWMRPYDDLIHFRVSSTQSWNIGGNSTTEIPVGEWTHITYVKRGNKLTLFVNGVLNSSAAITGTVVSNEGDIYIGDSPWYQGTSMLMDDYRIYSHGMREADALALAGATPAPDDPPPPVPPIAVITAPADNADVDGVVKIAVEASGPLDGFGTLDVEVRADGGWETATWNAAQETYNYMWDTGESTLGPVVVKARATDSNNMTTNAANIDVEVVAVPVDYADLVVADGAVAYWKLNDGGGGAYDAIDQTHKAYYEGVTTKTAPLLPEGGFSATFDGVDDYIRVKDHVDINAGGPYDARSIELWFKSNKAGKRQVLWEEGGSTVGISIYADNGKIHAGAWNRSGNVWDDDVFVKTPFEAGEVYHVVVVLKPSAGKLKLFVNGELAASATGVEAMDRHRANIGIGARNGSTRFADKVKSGGVGNYLDGVVDDVAIYNSILSNAKVAAHYAAGLD
ncbi:MAG: LamG domain-containing protein [bacterium]|nr:LamG domain-containing protein [bacterium]